MLGRSKIRGYVAKALAAGALIVGAGAAGGAIPVFPASAATAPSCTHASGTTTCIFSYTGAEQPFVVPSGVTSIHATAIGAAGGSFVVTTAGTGGEGAEVSGTLSVTSGHSLYVETGGAGCSGCSGGFNGGGAVTTSAAGSGGGASDVQTKPRATATALNSRLIVAGGGGGGGWGGNASGIGKGGNGGTAGTGGTGGTGSSSGTCTSSGGAGGSGASTSGGSGGAGGSGTGTRVFTGATGPAGALGSGGAGGFTFGLLSGGGGGGGYFGGGGGGSGGGAEGLCGIPTVGGETLAGGGGGGGGSSLLATGLESAGTPTSSPASVTLSWTGTLPAPVALSTSYRATAGKTLNVPAPGLRSNGTSYGAVLSVVTNPAHGTLSLNADGGFTYTPTSGYVGTDSFTYKEHNTAGTSTGTVTLTVDQAPAITSGASTTFTVGAAGTFQVTTTGFPSGATIHLSESGALPSTVTFADNHDGTATLSGTPAATTGGTYAIKITATNGVVPAATQTFTLTVDQAPAITSGASTTFTVGTTGSFQVTVKSHTYPTPPTYSVVSGTLPKGLTLAPTGKISGNPAATAAGKHSFKIEATNGVTPAATQTFTLTVDQAPAITSGASTTFTVGAAGTFQVTTTGFPSGATIHLSESGALPSTVTFADNHDGTATLSGTPAATTGGTYAIKITATNGVVPAATQTFTLTVDQAPAITSGASTTFTVGTTGSFQVTVKSHTYPTPPTYSVVSGTLPKGLTLAPTGKISGNPAATAAGKHSFKIEATNGVTPAATQTFTLTVDQAPAITTPTATTTFIVGTVGSFTFAAAGYPAPTFSESGTLPAGVTFTAAGKLSGVPAAGTVGDYPINVKAANGIGADSTKAFTLVVAKQASSTSVSVSPTSVKYGTAVTFSVTVTHPHLGTPTGKVTVAVNGTAVCSVTLTASDTGSGSCTSSSAPIGSAEKVTASYAGDANFDGSSGTSATTLTVTAPGYDLVGADGGVFVFNPPGATGGFYGSLPGLHIVPNKPVVGMVPTVTDEGYFLVGADGGVFAFGTAPFLGSLPSLGVTPACPITGIAAADTDKGYFLVGCDGGVFAFGTVPFLGSLPGDHVSADNIIGIAATPNGTGYWLVSSTGTVYAFGKAQTLGTAKSTPSPVSAIAGTPTGGGYWITTRSGAVYAFGNAKYFGSLTGLGVTPAHPVIGIVHSVGTGGYWLIGSDGGVFAFGNAGYVGSLPGLGISVTDIVGAVPTG